MMRRKPLTHLLMEILDNTSDHSGMSQALPDRLWCPRENQVPCVSGNGEVIIQTNQPAP